MSAVNYLPADIFLDTEDGVCEECDDLTEEQQLRRCQLGMCGKFLCPRCIQVCSTCLINSRHRTEDLFVFCRKCANKIRPTCHCCEQRFCRSCTDFKKCQVSKCPKTFCSLCQLKPHETILLSGKCTSCSAKRLNSLQDLCKNTIRMTIATCRDHMQQEDNSNGEIYSPTSYINETIKQLQIPICIINMLLV